MPPLFRAVMVSDSPEGSLSTMTKQAKKSCDVAHTLASVSNRIQFD